MTNRPFRGDLVRPDQVGTLLDDTKEPRLRFLPALTDATAKVLARSGNGELHFVGRSLDSMHDLLGGALERTSWHDRVHQLPMSLKPRRDFTDHDTAPLREHLAAAGITPHRLARGTRPTVFVDLVHEGETFTELYLQLRRWIVEDREAWPVVRRKLRFLGVTPRRLSCGGGTTRAGRPSCPRPRSGTFPSTATSGTTSATTSRSSRRRSRGSGGPTRASGPPIAGRPPGAPWPRRSRWSASGGKPGTRGQLVRTVTREPAMAESWLRTLVTEPRY
jgi:hypothetical protein